MLSLVNVLQLLAEGKTLPQELLPVPSDEAIIALQDAEPELLNRLFEAMSKGDDPVNVLMADLKELAGKHGWFAAAGILCMSFARRYRPDQIPSTIGVGQDTVNLLRMIPLAADHESHDEGAWTIPMAMLASLGEVEALTFTACAAMSAGVGYTQGVLEARAEGS
jgi:hypothetical protein